MLVVGASGGIGTAFLPLYRLAELSTYGLASKGNAHVPTEYGAIPIDSRTQDFVEVIRERPERRRDADGAGAVFDGIGGDSRSRGFSLLRRGGRTSRTRIPGASGGWFGCSGGSPGTTCRRTGGRPNCTGPADVG